MEIRFVNDDTRTHNTFTKKLVNIGKKVHHEEVADHIVDLDPIETNEHVEIISGQYVQVWLPDMDGPDQIVIEGDPGISEVVDFLNTLPEGTVLIMGSKYPKLQEVYIYHKVGAEWYIQMHVQLDMSDGDSITVY